MVDPEDSEHKRHMTAEERLTEDATAFIEPVAQLDAEGFRRQAMETEAVHCPYCNDPMLIVFGETLQEYRK